MLVAYLVFVIIFCLVNGLIYGSAIWLLWRGLKFFPSKPYLLFWPGLLLLINLYFAFIVTPQDRSDLNALEAGVVYQTLAKPDHIAIRGYASVTSNPCRDLCLEMLLEGHVRYVTIIWDNLRQGDRHESRSVTYEAFRGDCLAYPSSVSQISQYHAFYGYCVSPVEIDEVPKVEIILDANLNYFEKKLLEGRHRKYVTGMAILDRSQSDAKILAIQAGNRMSIDSVLVPVMFRTFNGNGMEGAPKLDGGLVRRRLKPEHPKDNKPDWATPYKESLKKKEAEYRSKLAHKHALLKAAMNLELDGVLDIGMTDKPDIAAMEKLIRRAYESGDEGHVKTAVELARTYDGFPFLGVMREFTVGEKNRSYYQAQGYIDRWMRETDPVTYKKLRAERKKQTEEEKARRQFESAKRFCELESRRDGRDCSQYQNLSSNNGK